MQRLQQLQPLQSYDPTTDRKPTWEPHNADETRGYWLTLYGNDWIKQSPPQQIKDDESMFKPCLKETGYGIAAMQWPPRWSRNGKLFGPAPSSGKPPCSQELNLDGVSQLRPPTATPRFSEVPMKPVTPTAHEAIWDTLFSAGKMDCFSNVKHEAPYTGGTVLLRRMSELCFENQTAPAKHQSAINNKPSNAAPCSSRGDTSDANHNKFNKNNDARDSIPKKRLVVKHASTCLVSPWLTPPAQHTAA